MSETALTVNVREDDTMTAVEIRARVQLVAQVMAAVMKKGVHYGVVPGTPKPSLWKPGAEKLAMTFGISVTTEVLEEKLDDHEVSYRVRATATASNGRVLASTEGVCSTFEDKYRWRAPIGQEWEEALENQRREKWKKGSGNDYKVKQVRMETGSVQNTILQMADKRAYVSVVRKATAASDLFSQDLEDIPEQLREDAAKEGGVNIPDPQRASESPTSAAAAAVPPPTTTTAAPAEHAPIPGQNPNGTLAPLTVARVAKVKEGNNEKGAWVFWIIETDGGKFGTFSSTVSGNAETARAQGKKVMISAKPSAKGAPEITELTVAA